MKGLLVNLLLLLVCCATLSAQGQQDQDKIARLQLVNGDIVEGRVHSLDDKGVTLEVGGDVRRFENSEIDRMLALGLAGENLQGLRAKRDQPKPVRPIFAPAPAGETEDPSDDEESFDEEEVDDPVDLTDETATSATPARGTIGTVVPDATPDSLLTSLIRRYAWFVPDTPGYKASAGMAFLVLLSLLIQLSARMSQVEDATFGKAMFVSVGMTIVATIQVALPLTHPLWLVGFLVVDAVLWFMVISSVFRSPFIETLVMLICFTLLGMVGLVVLSSMGLVLQTTSGL